MSSHTQHTRVWGMWVENPYEPGHSLSGSFSRVRQAWELSRSFPPGMNQSILLLPFLPLPSCCHSRDGQEAQVSIKTHSWLWDCRGDWPCGLGVRILQWEGDYQGKVLAEGRNPALPPLVSLLLPDAVRWERVLSASSSPQSQAQEFFCSGMPQPRNYFSDTGGHSHDMVWEPGVLKILFSFISCWLERKIPF